jgi:16S rRNA (cytosine967-C5)-methyltransferase
MKISSYILAATYCLSLYGGGLPFAAWLKQYFRDNKKFGSRDRKIIAHLCYCFFRLGNAFEFMAVEERVVIGLFLTSQTGNKLLAESKPGWNEMAHLSTGEKFAFLNAAPEDWMDVFPHHESLSPQIDKEIFITNHLIQPDLYLRLRPGHENVVKEKLANASIEFREINRGNLALDNATKLEEVISLDVEAVVQDSSSQEVLLPLSELNLNKEKNLVAWDCCAASGGKSILLFDTYPNIHLTVSDVRSSILQNLHHRFQRAGIRGYDSLVADVSRPQFTMTKQFDLVVCDAPCTGSGTWSRTPENLSYFKKEKIEYYANLQKWIGLNAVKALKKGGAFLYVTCSVFEQENEDVAAHIQKETKLTLRSTTYFKGYDRKSDTLFAALFTL